MAAAREVGQLFLDAGQVPQAWPYFRTIGEFDPVARAIESLAPKAEYDEAQEEIMQIALYEAAHPVKGLELLLHSHGTCNTITALDQQMQQMTGEDSAPIEPENDELLSVKNPKIHGVSIECA